jgi:DNA-binding NarL/FixJ family response regulator
MDRRTADSDPFDHAAGARVSFASASTQSGGHSEFGSTPNTGAPAALSFVWTKLCEGQLRIARHVQEEFWTTLHLEARHANDPSRWLIRGRSLAVLQRVLMGRNLKFISLDLALSSSTVSAEFQAAMRALELEPRISSLPMYLPQLWHAGRTRPTTDAALRASLRGIHHATVWLPRPDLRLAAVLTCAELQVSSLLLQGKTHAEVAAARGTTTRTIANQLASIFEKLQVSGRLDLVTTLARGCRFDGHRAERSWEPRFRPITHSARTERSFGGNGLGAAETMPQNEAAQ